MNRFDRILALLLLLRSGQPVSASTAAERFAVSPRTIYRDMETLSALGVPVYAERGREGGFRLLEGYFLPPLMFSTGEAISLLLGLALLHNLKTKPFPAELEMAERKLLAAVPERLRVILAEAGRIIGFEGFPGDVFHPEPSASQPSSSSSAPAAEATASQTLDIFLQAILDRQTLRLRYRSPYRDKTEDLTIEPYGLFWDRDRWYLVGTPTGQRPKLRLWRADRVLDLRPHRRAAEAPPDFDVRDLLGRDWLKSAMAHWAEEAPVKIRLTPAQAARLKGDWYYRHAHFEQPSAGQVLMTLGEEDPAKVLELLRWLGPGAELLEPKAWRAKLRADLRKMLADYAA